MNYKQIIFPLLPTAGGWIEVRINKNATAYTQPDADTLILGSIMSRTLISVGSFKSGYSDSDGRILFDQMEIVFRDAGSYSGTVNGSPVSVDLLSSQSSFLDWLFDDDDAVYTVFFSLRRPTDLAGDPTTWDCFFIGGIDPLMVTRVHNNVSSPLTASEEITQQEVRAPVFAAIDALKGKTVGDLVDMIEADRSHYVNMDTSDPWFGGIVATRLSLASKAAKDPTRTRNRNDCFGFASRHVFGDTTYDTGSSSPLKNGPFAISVHSIIKAVADLCGFNYDDSQALTIAPALLMFEWQGGAGPEYNPVPWAMSYTDPIFLSYHHMFGFSPYDGAEYDWPCSWKRDQPVTDILRDLARQFGCHIYTHVSNSTKKIELRLRSRREEFGTIPADWTLLSGASKEEPRRINKQHIKIKYKADSEEILIPASAPGEGIEVELPLRTREYGWANAVGLFWQEYQLIGNRSFGDEKPQNAACVRGVYDSEQKKTVTNPDGWVLGACMFRHDTPNLVNRYYPNTSEWGLSKWTSVSVWDGYYAVSAYRLRSALNSGYGDARCEIGTMMYQEMLRRSIILTRKFSGILGTDGRVETVKPGTTTTFRYRGALRKFKVESLERNFMDWTTEVQLVEVPTSYTDLPFPSVGLRNTEGSETGGTGSTGGTTSGTGTNAGTVSTTTTLISPGYVVVRCATTANVTLSSVTAVDGVTFREGDHVLVKDQSTASQNGVYTYSSAGGLQRVSEDANDWRFVTVDEGTTNGGTYWTLTNAGPLTVGSSSLSFSRLMQSTGTANRIAYWPTASSIGAHADVWIDNAGHAIEIVRAGASDSGLGVYLNHASNAQEAVEIGHHGTGTALIVSAFGGGKGITIEGEGNSTNHVLSSTADGAAHAGYFYQAGSGKAIQGVINEVTNTNNAADFVTTGSGSAVIGTTTGSGTAGFFESQGAAPSAPVLKVSATSVWHDEPLLGGSTSGNGDLINLTGTETFRIKNDASIVGLRIISAAKTNHYTLAETDGVLLMDTTSGAITLTLPNPSGMSGRVWFILDQKNKFSTNAFTIDPDTYDLNGLTADRDFALSGTWIMLTTDGTRYQYTATYPRQNNGIVLLGRKTGMDGKTVANHTVSPNTDSGRKSVVTHIAVRATAATSVSVAPACSLGIVGTAYNDIVATTTLTGLNVADEVTVIQCGTAVNMVGGGTGITFRISTAATATTLTLAVDVFGYYID